MSLAWHNSWRRCQISGTISVPARPGANERTGRGHVVEKMHLIARRELKRRGEPDTTDNIIWARTDIHTLYDALWITIEWPGVVVCDKHLPIQTIKALHGKRVEGYTAANDHYAAQHRRWVYGKGFEPWVE